MDKAEPKKDEKKKDFLMGLSSKTAVVLGIVLFLVGRFLIGGVILEIAGIILFVVGIYRWNKELRANQQAKKEANNKG